MTDFAFDPPATPSLAIQGDEARFPLRRIICIGRNYAAHAEEMGGTGEKGDPFFFAKPADAAFDAGAGDDAVVPYPSMTEDLHHEIELAIAIKAGGRDIAEGAALDHVFGYAVAIDMTRRDLQAKAKKTGRPWDFAKGFDFSCPVGPIGKVEDATDFDVNSASISLTVDNVMKQDATLADMLWNAREMIALVSQAMELKPGDLLLTGTPAGVGPVVEGEEMRGQITGLPDVVAKVGAKLG